MNKNYILLGDKVVVIDDNFKLSERDNTTTVKEELICENIVEYLTNYLKITKDDLARKIYFLKKFLPVIGIAIFSVPSLCYLLGYLSQGITDMDTFIVVLIIALGEGVVAISGHNICVDNDRLKLLSEIVEEELEDEKLRQSKLSLERNLVSTISNRDIVNTIDEYYIDSKQKVIEDKLNKRLIKRRKI